MAKKQSQVVVFRKRQKAQQKKAKRVIKQVIALRKTKRRALKQRSKRAIITEKVISPRHKAELIRPGDPFQFQRGDLESTAIASFSYDPLTLTLTIQFWIVKVRKGVIISKRRGNTYIYFRVPEKVHNDFIKASSKGRYFNTYIKTQYDFKPL